MRALTVAELVREAMVDEAARVVADAVGPAARHVAQSAVDEILADSERDMHQAFFGALLLAHHPDHGNGDYVDTVRADQLAAECVLAALAGVRRAREVARPKEPRGTSKRGYER